ncbi:hypothetical protein OG992_15380 [Micromonospora sp. NBC_00362]|uniref:hypothetical protein n=1 Tax=Micromonospora sp. NBC_00362 TaxID=2975975 RepID=UPI002250AA4F|nr:hypothetical protein [Micromonospora sp. NBC_00362]MCX5118564.1 hypothetical protein [Micromonospora sp. NBC_00362]
MFETVADHPPRTAAARSKAREHLVKHPGDPVRDPGRATAARPGVEQETAAMAVEILARNQLADYKQLTQRAYGPTRALEGDVAAGQVGDRHRQGSWRLE